MSVCVEIHFAMVGRS